MTDTYGALSIPVAVPTDAEVSATGDPALDVWASYLQAFINTYGAAAWAKVYPRRDDNNNLIPPVLKTFTHQPTDETIAVFNERYLPALYLYRASGAEPKWEWIDGRIARDTITLLWVFPTGTQPAERIRVPYVNALKDLVDVAIEKYLDPCWTYPGDPDPLAASIAADPDAVKISIATSTSAQTYSGAALNGAVGNATFAQPRAATVTLGGVPGDFVDGSTIVVTGLGVLGTTLARTLTIDASLVPYALTTDYAFTKITSIAVAAQATTAGTLSFGLGAFVGRGSLVLNFAPTGLRRAGQWRAQPITIPTTGPGGATVPRYYDAVEIPLEGFDVWDREYPTGAGLEGTLLANGGGYSQGIKIP
jgi:hypothetical protein